MVPRSNFAIRTELGALPNFSPVMKDHASSSRPPADRAPRLPAKRSFVVQFSGDSAADRRTFAGRIEHVLSGEVAGFSGGDELLAALESALVSAGRATRADQPTRDNLDS